MNVLLSKLAFNGYHIEYYGNSNPDQIRWIHYDSYKEMRDAIGVYIDQVLKAPPHYIITIQDVLDSAAFSSVTVLRILDNNGNLLYEHDQ